MIAAQPISLLNTGLPVLLLVAMAILLPRLIEPSTNTSQFALAVVAGATSLSCLLTGAAVFALSYSSNGADVVGAFRESALGTATFLLRLSASSALIWAPVLALVWYVRAQGVERRKGALMAEGKAS